MKRKILLSYVPHGIDPKWFYPIKEGDVNYKEFKEFEEKFKKDNGVEFIVFWNNRNIRRKMPGDVVLAFRRFCDQLPKEKADKCCLLMKTQVRDQNGTDLIRTQKTLAPRYKILFNESLLGTKEMNFLYNLVDVTINIGSNEGFGLSNAESIMAGTPTITNVTGGLQDQCRFSDDEDEWVPLTMEFPTNHAGTYKNSGPWVIPVFPSNRSIQGSIPTPYIFDDRASFEDVADAIMEWYKTPKEKREMYGEVGRNWMLTNESGMSSTKMGERFITSVDRLFEEWQPSERFEMMQYKSKTYPDEIGIVWDK